MFTLPSSLYFLRRYSAGNHLVLTSSTHQPLPLYSDIRTDDCTVDCTDIRTDFRTDERAHERTNRADRRAHHWCDNWLADHRAVDRWRRARRVRCRRYACDDGSYDHMHAEEEERRWRQRQRAYRRGGDSGEPRSGETER